jgi:hypothetical protein
MGRPLGLLLAAAALTAVAVGAVAFFEPMNDPAEPAREEPFRTTPLEELETTTLTVPRATFCPAVDPRQVEAALGEKPVDAQSYESGEEVTLADGVTDVAHEFGCTWVAADQSEARAWVFAPPVDAERARRLVSEVGREKDCQAYPDPAYGSPSVGMLCPGGEGGSRASYQGLFGDAWLTCELSTKDPEVSGDDLLERTGGWCAGVALAASGTQPSGA